MITGEGGPKEDWSTTGREEEKEAVQREKQ